MSLTVPTLASNSFKDRNIVLWSTERGDIKKDLSNYASPMLCNSSVLDYLNMRDEGGLVKGLVKVEIACFGQHRR